MRSTTRNRAPRRLRRWADYRSPILTVSSVVVALAIAGCGGYGSSSAPSKSSSGGGGGAGGYSGASGGASASSSASGGQATVAVKTSKLGNILVDGSGRSLYLFEKDTGATSTCFDACAQVWPPFTSSGKPQAGAGASVSLLGTTKRKDGKTEVTYHGHPLYYYQADTNPGDTAGQKLKQFGAEWYVLSAKGVKVETRGS